jgi:hypothetical protein
MLFEDGASGSDPGGIRAVIPHRLATTIHVPTIRQLSSSCDPSGRVALCLAAMLLADEELSLECEPPVMLATLYSVDADFRASTNKARFLV